MCHPFMLFLSSINPKNFNGIPALNFSAEMLIFEGFFRFRFYIGDYSNVYDIVLTQIGYRAVHFLLIYTPKITAFAYGYLKFIRNYGFFAIGRIRAVPKFSELLRSHFVDENLILLFLSLHGRCLHGRCKDISLHIIKCIN